jgi:predicted aldo/keto reductase-like oxidoreductase
MLNDHMARLLKEREPERSLASWSFRYIGMYPRVLTSLSGMNRMEHLEDNVRTHAPIEPLADDELALLERVADEFAHHPAIPCTGCNYCLEDCGPNELIWPMDINIPGIFAHYNKCLNEDLVLTEGTVEQREFRRARRAFLTSYNEIERLRQADRCIECKKCVTHCPLHIDIPTKLHMIEDYVEQLKDSMV